MSGFDYEYMSEDGRQVRISLGDPYHRTDVNFGALMVDYDIATVEEEPEWLGSGTCPYTSDLKAWEAWSFVFGGSLKAKLVEAVSAMTVRGSDG